jgi:hypothetical protein
MGLSAEPWKASVSDFRGQCHSHLARQLTWSDTIRPAPPAATTHTIVGAAGNVYVVVVNGANIDAGNGAIGATGRLDVTTTNNSRINGSIEPPTAIISITMTPASGSPLTYSGANNDTRDDLEKLVNISTRSHAGSGTDSLIAGFVVAGEQPKKVLVRAIGPTLGTAFNVSLVLADPILTLFGPNSATVVAATNDNWNAADVSTFNAVGAFALPVGSRDAAIVTTLEPGSYTAQVSSHGVGSGVALVEVYELPSDVPSRGGRIINISTRAVAGNADATMTVGFVISGTVPKRVLIRGVGPALTQFGVTGALVRPELALFSGATMLAQNSVWGSSPDAPSIAAASAGAGAFALPANSQDSALIVNLAPGNYTAQVSGGGGSTGVALIEVYEVL